MAVGRALVAVMEDVSATSWKHYSRSASTTLVVEIIMLVILFAGELQCLPIFDSNCSYLPDGPTEPLESFAFFKALFAIISASNNSESKFRAMGICEEAAVILILKRISGLDQKYTLR